MKQDAFPKMRSLDVGDAWEAGSARLHASFVIPAIFDKTWLIQSELGQIKSFDIAFELTFDFQVIET